MQSQAQVLVVNQVTVSSSTATAIASGKPKLGVQVKALKANTGLIYLGNHDVSSTKCYPLDPGESVFIPVDAVDLIYALAAVNGEKVHYIIL